MEDEDQKIEKESPDAAEDAISEAQDDSAVVCSKCDLPSDKLRKYKYEGSLDCDGLRHGFGKAYFSNGDVYEGEYKLGLRHGLGTYTFKKGGVYVGSWMNGMKHGQGTFNYCDSTNYTGEFCEDKRQGYGKYEYSNSDVYEGYWSNHKRHGYGSYIYFQAGVKFQGLWKEGCRTSEGSLTLFDGSPVPELSPGCIQVPIMVENPPDTIRCEYLPSQDVEREMMLMKPEKVVQQLETPHASLVLNEQNFQTVQTNNQFKQNIENDRNA